MAARGRSCTACAGIATVPSYVVMQPTTLCNLDCAYCYLPFRRAPTDGCRSRWPRRWPRPSTTGRRDDRFSVVWHGGEPLAAGREHLAALMAPFGASSTTCRPTPPSSTTPGAISSPSTRCGSASASTGPRRATASGSTGRGRPAYDRILQGRRRRCAATTCPFSALAVVSDPRPGLATELYDYFLDLGCDVLGINIEEQEGVNARVERHDAGGGDARSGRSWSAAWRRDPRIHLREIEWALRYAGGGARRHGRRPAAPPLDPIPTIGSRRLGGRCSRPELAGFTDPRYGDFAPATCCVPRWRRSSRGRGRARPWIGEFLTGVEACRATCPYFGFCGGAHAANRYFELGAFRRYGDRALPQQQDPPTGGSARPCPRSQSPAA